MNHSVQFVLLARFPMIVGLQTSRSVLVIAATFSDHCVRLASKMAVVLTFLHFSCLQMLTLFSLKLYLKIRASTAKILC